MVGSAVFLSYRFPLRNKHPWDTSIECGRWCHPDVDSRSSSQDTPRLGALLNVVAGSGASAPFLFNKVKIFWEALLQFLIFAREASFEYRVEGEA
jgi:hypothetical protein